MNDPDLEQIGDALVRVARQRAAVRPGRHRRMRVTAVAALSAAALAVALSSMLAHPWGGGGSVDRSEPTDFTQYVLVYDSGPSRAIGCAVARCATIDAANGRKVTSVQLVAIAHDVRSARVVGAPGRRTRIPPAARTRGPIVFRLENRAADAVVVQLFNAAGEVVQTLRA